MTHKSTEISNILHLDVCVCVIWLANTKVGNSVSRMSVYPNWCTHKTIFLYLCCSDWLTEGMLVLQMCLMKRQTSWLHCWKGVFRCVSFIWHKQDVLTLKTTAVFPLCVCVCVWMLCVTVSFSLLYSFRLRQAVSVRDCIRSVCVCVSMSPCVCSIAAFNEHATADFLTWTKHVEKAAFPWILHGLHCPLNTPTHRHNTLQGRYPKRLQMPDKNGERTDY